MEPVFVDCPDGYLEVKQELTDEVDPLAVMEEDNKQLVEYKVKVESVKESADCPDYKIEDQSAVSIHDEECELIVKQEIIEVVDDMKVEIDEDTSDVKEYRSWVEEPSHQQLQNLRLCELSETSFSSPLEKLCKETKQEKAEDQVVEERRDLQNLDRRENERDKFPCKPTSNKKCTACRFTGNQGSYVNKQLSVCTGGTALKCKVCNKSLVGCLLRHKYLHHKGKPYQCKVCNKSLTSSNSLLRHQRIHTGIKPYKCEVCNKSFTESSSLRKHQLIHSGEKPYKCEVCYKSFTQSGHLREHHLIHTAEKLYKCKLCNKSFTQSGGLRKHQSIHSGEKLYKCKVCNKSFTHSSTLFQHQRIHTGIKPYKCKVCNKSFTQSSSLRKHQRIHTGIKPYRCEVCNKSFTESSSLRKHQLIHTGIKP